METENISQLPPRMTTEKRFQISVGKRIEIGDYCASIQSAVAAPAIVIAPNLKALLLEVGKHVRKQNIFINKFPLKREPEKSLIITNGNAE